LRRARRAAFALAVALVAAQLPRDAQPPEACREPAELAARAGRSSAVACRAAARGRPALRGPARLLFALPLDLNRADAESLQALPGIGPARARAIVAERERRPFASTAEIVRVRGIGPVTARRLAGAVAVEPLQENR
jgi:competence protein ComEA